MALLALGLVALLAYLLLRARFSPVKMCRRCAGTGCRRCDDSGHRFRRGVNVAHRRR